MTPEAVVYVLYYYIAFWLINSAAYAIVSIGANRWRMFARGLDAERVLSKKMYLTLAFGVIRFTAGTVAVVLWVNDYISALTTIVIMGMSSLMLNACFIFIEGVMLNREAHTVLSATPNTQQLFREAIEQFDSLRRTVRNA